MMILGTVFVFAHRKSLSSPFAKQRKTKTHRALSGQAGRVRAEALGRIALQDGEPQQPAATDGAEFVKLRKVLEKSFPLVRKHLEHAVVGEHSLLYKWTGRHEKPKLKRLAATGVDVPPLFDSAVCRVLAASG